MLCQGGAPCRTSGGRGIISSRRIARGWTWTSSTAFSPAPTGRLASHARRWSARSEEHTSELQSRQYLVCRLLLEKKKKHERTHCRAHRLCSALGRRLRLAWPHHQARDIDVNLVQISADNGIYVT